MSDEYAKLREYDKTHAQGHKLFTACIEVALTYVLELDGPLPRTGLRHACEVLIDAIRERITYYLPDEYGRRKKIKPSAFELLPYALAHEFAEGITSLHMLAGGRDDESDTHFHWYDFDTGFVRLCLPIEEVMADPQAYLALCLDAASELQFQFGYAGFSVNYEDVYINSNQHLTTPIAARFRGVNLVHPDRYRIVLDGVPTVDWLTFVNRELVEKLGGFAALKAQEGDGVLVHPLKHGVAMQAGRKPLLGDVNLQESMVPYERVGAILAPVQSRVELMSDVAGGDEETQVWAKRFFPEGS